METMEMFESNTQSGGNSFSEGNRSSSGSEPFAVGTNLTLNLTLPSDGSTPWANGDQPFVVGTNTTLNITYTGEGSSLDSGSGPVVLGTNKTVNQNFTGGSNSSTGADTLTGNNAPSSGEYQWNFNGSSAMTTGNAPIAGGSGNPFAGGAVPSSGDSLTGGGNPFAGGAMGGSNPFSAVGNAPNNDENYQWNFNREASGGSDLDALFQSSPWGTLSEVGITSFSQIFPNASADGENPFASGGSSLGGGSSFGGGSGNPLTSGGSSFGGGSSNPLTGGGSSFGGSTANAGTDTNYTWDI